MSAPLALKFRPRRFADIVGNEFTTRVLVNSIVMGKLKTAYFFAGGKGSGKCVRIGAPVYDPSVNSPRALGLEEIRRVAGLVDNKIVSSSFQQVVFLGPKSCLRLTTNCGSQLDVATTHKFLTPSGFKEAAELSPGDLVATARRLPSTDIKPQLTRTELQLVGYMLGDGSCGDNVRFWLNRNEKSLRAHFETLLVELGIPRALIRHAETDDPNSDVLSVNCSDYDALPDAWRTVHAYQNKKESPLRQLLKKTGLYQSTPHSKSLPAQIWSLPEEEARHFLACLWVTDGHFSVKLAGRGPTHDVAYTTVSEVLARGLRLFLLRFGVRTKLRKRQMLLSGTGKRFPAFEVRAAFAEDALWLCGLPLQEKQADAAVVRAILENSDKTRDDLFPMETWTTIQREFTARGGIRATRNPGAVSLLGSSGRLRFTTEHRPSRKTVKRWALALNSAVLHALADSDVMWERVASVAELGTHDCVDISDSSADNTFIADTFVTHNTSTARIFAKAINCQTRGEMSAEPCGTCPSCVEIDREVLMGDVQEIDAASNNSVASIRTLVSQLEYVPHGGGKKIVILDEVHQLSTAAANALLKTLEEPPEHVIFIFCTTDPQKVLDTIRSRTLYFEFSRLTTDEIVGRLHHVAAAENLTLADDAAHLIAQSVNGALRDAITILDQASILDSTITLAVVAQIVGYVAIPDLYELFAHIQASNDQNVQYWLDAMTNKLDQDILTSILHFLETLLLLNIGADVTRRVPPDLADKVKKLATTFTMAQLFSMGEWVKATLADYRRLALRDSRILLRLLLVALVLAKEDKDKVAPDARRSIFDLASSARPVALTLAAKLRATLNAEEIDLTESVP